MNRKTLVYYHCRDRNFLLLCSVFALDRGLVFASDIPTVQSGSSSTFRTYYEVSS